MKKFQKLFLLWILIQLFFSFSFASNVSPANKAKIDNILTVVERDRSKETIVNQISKYEKFIKAFSKVSFKDNEQKEMIKYLVKCFQKKIDYLKTQVKTQDQSISNVDRNRVKEERLAWHNEERKNLWLEPYKTNSSLDYSALIRAQELANNLRTSNTHSRDSSYGYSYDKILNWFNNLWITFDYKSTAFTENIAYQYYVCKKSDCTQDMINALRKGFDFFMKEKSYNGSHYRAIVHEYFDQLWFWVATNWKYYWVVTHYGINVN